MVSRTLSVGFNYSSFSRVFLSTNTVTVLFGNGIKEIGNITTYKEILSSVNTNYVKVKLGFGVDSSRRSDRSPTDGTV